MNIVWFTWKDKKHPAAGGAESISSEMARKLVKDGHSVTVLSSFYLGAKKIELLDGYKVVRVGNRYTVYFRAATYYLKHLSQSTDLVIEEINTIPFMTQWYVKCKKVLMMYQLCREIWFYQIAFPLNVIGYVLEPLYLFLLRNNYVITESESTKRDLIKYGFNKNRIDIIPIFIDLKPISKSIIKFKHFTALSLGSIRSMKRTLHQIKAFEIAKKTIPSLKMIVAGSWDNSYGASVKNYINQSKFSKDISFLGAVNLSKKAELLGKSHILLMTSLKEGWGLTVTEAASQGTSTIGYDIDGLRDSIEQTKVGVLVPESIEKLAEAIVKFFKKSNFKNGKTLIASTKHLSKEKTYRTFVKICKKNHLFQ